MLLTHKTRSVMFIIAFPSHKSGIPCRYESYPYNILHCEQVPAEPHFHLSWCTPVVTVCHMSHDCKFTYRKFFVPISILKYTNYIHSVFSNYVKVKSWMEATNMTHFKWISFISKLIIQLGVAYELIEMKEKGLYEKANKMPRTSMNNCRLINCLLVVFTI
jgi:hypothetical protein